MKIKLSPIASAIPLSILHVDGDKITINNITLDFTPLQIGEILPISAIDPSCGIASDITRDSQGHINLTILLPHGSNAPEETRFPVAYDTPIVINSGDVPLPPYDTIIEEEVSND